MKGFTTKALHGNRKAFPYGALRAPVYHNAAFEFENSQSISDAFMGKVIAPAYSRTANPSVSELEQKITFLCGALGALAFSSGMAAITNTLLSVAQSGDNIVASPFLFGNTYSLLEDTLKPWGLETRFADFNKAQSIEELIDGNTRALFLETIANPQMVVYDFEMLSEIAEKHQILLILDNTVATPYIFNSKKYGVHLEIMSTTKYISGGGTSIGGIVIDNGNYCWERIPKLKALYQKAGEQAFMQKIRKEVFRNTGACLSPESAYLQSLGLETMALRIDRSCENTHRLATFLQGHPEVKQVKYPGLQSSPYYGLAQKYFQGKAGGILTLELKSREKCFAFMDRLKLVRRATNINDNKTLIIHPSSTIFSEFSSELKEKMGIGDKILRLSVGIEDYADLQADLLQALNS